MGFLFRAISPWGLRPLPWYENRELLFNLFLIFSLLILTGFMIAYRSLKHQVRNRTRELELELEERLKTQAELDISNRAIAAASNGIVISDPRREGNPIIYANPAFERITGYTIGEILGGNCRILQGSDTRQPALIPLRHAISRGKASKVELRNYRKDGSMFWNELSVSPIHDDHGNLIHFIGIQNDISEQKLLLEALHTIATGFSGISGLDYFEQVAGWLTGVLEVEYASIGRLLIDEEGTEHIETMAFVAHGHLERNFTYNLAHTPCETVVGKQPCCYPSDIQELFPLDNDLKRLGIEAYIGAPLFRSSNEPIGLLSVMHGSPLKQTDLAATILQIVASRTAAEMERLESEQQLEKARSQAQESR